MMRKASLATAAAMLLLMAASCSAQSASTFKVAPPPVEASQLPNERPPLWTFRTISDSKVTPKSHRSGAKQITVVHKPFPNVTDVMLQWMYANLAIGTGLGADNKTWPIFLLFHPRDHAKTTNSNSPKPAKGNTYTTFVEFPLTGCGPITAVPSAAGFSCPSGSATANPGFLSNSSASLWSDTNTTETTNGNPRLASLSRTRAHFFTKRCNDKGQCADTVKTQHAWRYNRKKNETVLTTTLIVGLTWYKPSNEKILNTWRGNMTVDDKLARAALHFTEEYGTIVNWLPAAWRAATPVKPGRRHLFNVAR